MTKSTSGDGPELWLLAAGAQTRMPHSRLPKCLSRLPGRETILSRLLRQARARGIMRHCMVVSDYWPAAHLPRLSSLYCVSIVERDRPIGASVEVALDPRCECRAELHAHSSNAIVMAADTVLSEQAATCLFAANQYIDGDVTAFDPWAWITVRYVTGYRRQKAASECFADSNRIIGSGRILPRLDGAVNVNTAAALKRARALVRGEP